MIIADVRPDIGLGNAFCGSVFCGYAIIQKHAMLAGDEVLIWSNIYIALPPADGSSFEFFFFRAFAFFAALSCLLSN